jgi:hypothetical protein
VAGRSGGAQRQWGNHGCEERGGGGGLAGEDWSVGEETERKERRGEKKKIKMVGPTFGGGNGEPPKMKGERGNLKECAKWRSSY